MWLWDTNNINFILGYKSTTVMEWLIDQKTQNSNPQMKVNAHENKEGLTGLVTSFVRILLNERKREEYE